MAEFRAGDSALIVRAKCTDNIGKVVTLLASSTDAQYFIPANGKNHLYSFQNPGRVLVWHVAGDLTNMDSFGLQYPSNEGVIPQDWLIPLDGHQGDSEDREVLDLPASVKTPVVYG